MAASLISTRRTKSEEALLVSFLQQPTGRNIDELVQELSSFAQTTANQFWQSRIPLEKLKTSELYGPWLKILSSKPESLVPREFFFRNIYWLLIQEGLSGASSERQKYSLLILKLSIQTCEGFTAHSGLPLIGQPIINIDKSVLDSVERFCGIFETIIHGRYSNQIEECLKDVPSNLFKNKVVETAGFHLDPAWWIVLFMAAFVTKNASNVQNLVGNWILSQDFANFTPSEQFRSFFLNYVIKWVSQGVLFNSSLRRNGRIVECEHGSNVARFIINLVQNMANDSVRSVFTGDILLKLRNSSMNEYAVGYIVQGLNIYSLTTKDKLSSELEISSNITQKIWKSDGNYFDRLSASSSLRVVIDYHMSHILNRRLVIDPQHDIEDDTSSNLYDLVSVSALSDLLSQPHNSIHKNNGLVSFCDHLCQVIETAGVSSIEVEDLLKIFENLRTILTRQRHSRDLAYAIIPVFFNAKVIEANRASVELKEFLTKTLRELSKLARSKIQVWIPLCQSIRKAYLNTEEFSDYLPLEEFLTEFAQNPPKPSLTYLLDCAISQDLYWYQNINGLVAYADETIGHSYLFDVMNRLRKKDYKLGISMIQNLLRPWLSTTKTTGSSAFPKHISIFQSVLILSGRCLQGDDSIQELQNFQASVFKLLALGISPIFRYLLQWMYVASYWSHFDILNEEQQVLQELTNSINEDVYPKKIVSLIRMGTHLARHRNVSSSFIKQFIEVLPTFCAYDKVAARLEAQWAVPIMMDIINSIPKSTSELEGIKSNETFKTLYKYITGLKSYQNPPKQWTLEAFDPNSDQNLCTLFQGSYLALDSHVWHAPTLYDLQRLSEDASGPLPACLPYFPSSQGSHLYPPTAPRSQFITSHSTKYDTSLGNNITIPLQSKAGLTIIPSLETEDRKTDKVPIILIGSLITAAVNLGGLSRLSEIYALDSLHLPSLSIASSAPFLSTALSSPSHLTIEETPASSLVAFINEKKIQGWIILGVEQTDASLILGESELPQGKVVIVMGAESTGIPGEVLALCDVCVEIKQWGFTRSLNVQTAAATVLFELRRERKRMKVAGFETV
jgi:tRNA guanosine-2'-O-methyltransferase